MTQLADLETTCWAGWYGWVIVLRLSTFKTCIEMPVPRSVEISSVEDYYIPSFLIADLAENFSNCFVFHVACDDPTISAASSSVGQFFLIIII